MAVAEAFIMITPEPGAIVSYGAASAGLRASGQIRQVLAELRTHIIRNGIAISEALKTARQAIAYPA